MKAFSVRQETEGSCMSGNTATGEGGCKGTPDWDLKELERPESQAWTGTGARPRSWPTRAPARA